MVKSGFFPRFSPSPCTNADSYPLSLSFLSVFCPLPSLSPLPLCSRTSVRVNAASKGIVGDGKVNLVVSKDEFEAQQSAAGDNLVRAPLPLFCGFGAAPVFSRFTVTLFLFGFFLAKKNDFTWRSGAETTGERETTQPSAERKCNKADTPYPSLSFSLFLSLSNSSLLKTGGGADLHQDVRPVQGGVPSLRRFVRGAS